MPLAGLDICKKRSDPIRAEFGNHAAVVMAYSQFTFLFVAQLSNTYFGCEVFNWVLQNYK